MKSVREGYKMTELGEIPEEWEVKSLEDIRDNNDRYSFAGGPFGSDLKSEHYTEEGVRVIQLQNIGNGYFNNNYKIYTYVDKADELLKCNIYPNDLIIAKMAEPVARACKIPNHEKRYLMCSDGIRLSIDKNYNNTDYIMYSINSGYFRKNAIANSTGSTRLRIGLNELKSLPILIPELKEQEKIASILSTVDEQIDNVDALIEKNKELKKGLMQTLLSKGIGHKTFKKTEIGEIPEEWEIKSLEQACDIVDYRGKTPEKVEEGILLVTAKNINKGFIDYNISREYVKEDDYERVMSRGIPKKGDVIFTTEAPLGNVANIDDENIALAQRVIKFRGNEEYLDNYFLKYYMLCDTFQMELLSQSTGSTVLGIKGSRLKKLLVALPHKKEQEKIVLILSEVDKKVEEYKNKKQKLEEIKNGLMQQLLTGKIRVI